MNNNIKYYREMKGFTQNQLAELVGISRQYLSEIETYKKQPSVRIVFEVSKILQVKIEDLFYF